MFISSSLSLSSSSSLFLSFSLSLLSSVSNLLDGLAAAGIEFEPFPLAFSREPERRTTPRPPSKILRVPNKSWKLCKVKKQKFPNFSAKWIQHKIQVPRNSGNFTRGRSKNPLNFKQKRLFQNAIFCQKTKYIFLPSPGELLRLTCLQRQAYSCMEQVYR